MKRKRKSPASRKRVRGPRMKAEAALLSPRFERALVLANRLHARQKRKGRMFLMWHT